MITINRNKLHAEKTYVDGRTFDSKKEANRYAELLLMQRAGKISNLKCQVPFELIPARYEDKRTYTKTGKAKDKKVCIEKACVYIADFTYEDENGNYIVEDVKGYKGGAAYHVFTIKRKLMLDRFNIKVKEI